MRVIEHLSAYDHVSSREFTFAPPATSAVGHYVLRMDASPQSRISQMPHDLSVFVQELCEAGDAPLRDYQLAGGLELKMDQSLPYVTLSIGFVTWTDAIEARVLECICHFCNVTHQPEVRYTTLLEHFDDHTGHDEIEAILLKWLLGGEPHT